MANAINIFVQSGNPNTAEIRASNNVVQGRSVEGPNVSRRIIVKPVISSELPQHLTGEDDTARIKPSYYLEQFYGVMYYVGVSLYEHQPNTQISWKKIRKGVNVLQKVLFWNVNAYSICHSVFQAKYNFLNFIAGRGYSSFVDFSFYLTRFFLVIYSIRLFAFQHQITIDMFKSLREYAQHYNVASNCTGNSMKRRIPWIVGLITILLAIIRALFGSGIAGWSFEELILSSSLEFGEDILVWKSNVTATEAQNLALEHSANLTFKSVLFGGIVILRNCASNLQIGIVLDLMMFVATVTYILVMDFIADINGTLGNVNSEDSLVGDNLQEKRETVWRKYRMLKNAVSSVNNVYDPMLKLIHVGNLLMYTFFMTLCIFREHIDTITIILYGLNLVKAEVAYYVAGEIAEQNAVIRTWIRNWALHTGKITVNNVPMDANILLDELDQEPIGLGKGTFLIQQTSHYKFLGLVGSTFFALADDYKKTA